MSDINTKRLHDKINLLENANEQQRVRIEILRRKNLNFERRVAALRRENEQSKV